MRGKLRLELESLEDRRTPATFGVPWADPRHLTISFAPDQTQISASKSSLFQTLNAQAPTVDWQNEILRAAQSWASTTNVDLGFVNDTGLAFGANINVGATRKGGDIRVGATNLAATALAISVPPDPFFGDSWSGEVIYNAANNLNPSQATLYSVLLHEFGHTLGLPNSADPTSAMYNFANTPATGPNAGDIAALRALYGVRQSDQHDQVENNATFQNATHVELDDFILNGSPYVGQFPIVLFGDVTTNSDIDTYRIDVPLGYNGPMTFRLQSSGLSLLAPQLSVYSNTGLLKGMSLSTDPSGDTITVHLNQVYSGNRFYMRVQGATPDVFGFGRYSAAVIYDNATLPAYAARLDGIMTGPYDSLKVEDIGELFVDPAHSSFNDDDGSDDTIGGCNTLSAAAQIFSAVGVIQSVTDIDTYLVKTPQQAGPATLTITARAEAVNGGIPRAELLTTTGVVVPSTILANGDGRLTIQAINLTANTSYIVRLSGTTPTQLGNYSLSVIANQSAFVPQTFATGTISQGQWGQNLVVAQNAVFHFLFGLTGSSADAVRMTVEGLNGTIYYDVTVTGGSTANVRPVLLKTGTYLIRYNRISGISAITFSLRGAVLSDPIGPSAQDPTQNPAGPGSDLGTYYLQVLHRLKSLLKNMPMADVF